MLGVSSSSGSSSSSNILYFNFQHVPVHVTSFLYKGSIYTILRTVFVKLLERLNLSLSASSEKCTRVPHLSCMQEFCVSYSILGHGPQDLLGQLEQQSVVFIVVDGNVPVDADFILST